MRDSACIARGPDAFAKRRLTAMLHNIVLVAILLGIVSMWPLTAAAETQDLTAEQTRSAFENYGFDTSPILDWSWASPPVQSFVVHDPHSQCVLEVLVFRTVDDATRFQMSRSGSNLVDGYGPSVWNVNVAIMESTEVKLARMTQMQNEHYNGVHDDPALALAAGARHSG